MQTAKFNRKSFLANAEAFLEEKRARWVRDIEGTPIHQAALTYAKREFILPNEDLSCVTANDLFPNTDLGEWAMKCEKGVATREEASAAIRAAVVDGLREANAGIEKLRFSGASQSVAGGGTKTPDTAAAPVPEGANPSSAALLSPPEVSEPAPEAKSAPDSLLEPAKGIPEALVSTTVRVHRVTLGDVELVTTDRGHLEMFQAAQAQKRVLKATWEESPIGKLITNLCLSS
jgi:hypothetical protein